MITMESILHVLSESGLRAARFTAMNELIAEGYSGRQALDWLRKFSSADAPGGLGIRTQTFYEFWTPMRNIQEKVGKGALLRDEWVPGEGTMGQTPFNQVRQYNYIVDITATDAVTGDVDTRLLTIASDVFMTKGQIQAEAIDVVLSDLERYEFTGDIGAEFSHGTYQSGARMR